MLQKPAQTTQSILENITYIQGSKHVFLSFFQILNLEYRNDTIMSLT